MKSEFKLGKAFLVFRINSLFDILFFTAGLKMIYDLIINEKNLFFIFHINKYIYLDKSTDNSIREKQRIYT